MLSRSNILTNLVQPCRVFTLLIQNSILLELALNKPLKEFMLDMQVENIQNETSFCHLSDVQTAVLGERLTKFEGDLLTKFFLNFGNLNLKIFEIVDFKDITHRKMKVTRVRLYLIRKLRDLWNAVIVVKMFHNISNALEKVCSVSVLTLLHKSTEQETIHSLLTDVSWWIDKLRAYFRVPTPATSMFKWFRVLMASVRFFLAVSSCRMSLVMSRTANSLCSARPRMSRTLATRASMDAWALAWIQK